MKRLLICLLLPPVMAALTPVAAQEPAVPSDVPSLVRQLGASRVRLRDEADALLRTMPEAEAAVRLAAEQDPAEEVRLRAAAIARSYRDSLWTVAGATAAPKPPPPARYAKLRQIAASPDGSFVAGMYSGGAILFDARTAQQLRIVGTPGAAAGGDFDGVLRSVAISPDSRWVATTDESGGILIDDRDGRRVKTIPAARAGVNSTAPIEATEADQSSRAPGSSVAGAIIWGLHFLPDGKELLYANLNEGLVRCHLETGQKRILPLGNLRPRSLAITSDGKTAALGSDPLNLPCRLQTVDLATMSIRSDIRLKTIPNAVAITRDGSRVFVGENDGSILIHTPSDGSVKIIAQHSKPVDGLALFPDESILVAATMDPVRPMVLYDTHTMKEVWAAPQAEQGYHHVAVVDGNRIASTGNDSFLQIWQKRQASKSSPQ